MRATIIDVDRTSGPRVRWGAIFAGAVWGLAVMAVLTSLWLALAYPSEIDFVRDNLEWFIAGSGAFALFVAGFLAGFLTDNRGPGSGWLHGMTAWGLLLIAALSFGIPSVFGLFNVGQLRTIGETDLVGPEVSDVLWVTFLTLVVGAVAAAVGGTIGGAPRRGYDLDDMRRASIDESDLTEPLGRHELGRTVATGSDVTPRTAMPEDRPTGGERVLVSQDPDGVYVDQEGHRYVPEGVGSGSSTDRPNDDVR
jgi:hypothetical protein